jgi:hypothetical protein
MTTPDVSIITAAYNSADYIERVSRREKRNYEKSSGRTFGYGPTTFESRAVQPA